MLKVVLSGIFYPLAMLRYFEAALNRRDDIELFTAGPYTATWIPWKGGMHLPPKYAKAPDLTLPKRIQNFVPVDYIESQLPWQPDLWLQIDAGFHFYDKPARGKNVIVGTDPHVLNYDDQRVFAHTFYCMQTPYMEPGDEYLPYAYDPEWHRPEERPQNYDVCLIGLHYQQRNHLVTALREKGLKVYYDLGPVYDEARALYNQAPIGLNWSSAKDLTARVFELTAMKRLAVVNRVPDLERFFTSDDEIVTFDNLNEAIEKVQYYIAETDKQKQVAEAGYKAVKPHTWDARIEQIINDL